MRRIYLASSWRNRYQPSVVSLIRSWGHEVYDFRNPEDGDHGFRWSDLDPEWQSWDPVDFREALDHPIAVAGFSKDFAAMEWANTFVLLMPCGRSAHLELGWAIGQGRPTAIFQFEDGEPELMYKMADRIVVGNSELWTWLVDLELEDKLAVGAASLGCDPEELRARATDLAATFRVSLPVAVRAILDGPEGYRIPDRSRDLPDPRYSHYAEETAKEK